jgi:hypothetical protein
MTESADQPHGRWTGRLFVLLMAGCWLWSGVFLYRNFVHRRDPYIYGDWKPGLCRHPDAAGMGLPKPPTAQPQAVLRAHRKQANVIYVKPVWRLIMLIIRSIPESIFKTLKL